MIKDNDDNSRYKNFMKFRAAIVCIVFGFAILIPLFTISLNSGDVSYVENRYLAKIPHVLNENGKLNNQFFTEGKLWFEDHIGFRKQFVRIAFIIQFHIFRRSRSSHVHVGLEGWYFYTLNGNLDIALGTYPMNENTLHAILQSHLRTREILANKGIEYIVLLPVSKVSIYPEYIGIGTGEIIRTPADIIADYLEQNSDIHVVRLKDALLEEKKKHQVFYKTDTHWNHFGGYVVYKQIIKKMQEWGFVSPDEKIQQMRFMEKEHTGDLENMLGLKIQKERAYFSDFSNENAVLNEGEKYQALYNAVESAQISAKDSTLLFENKTSPNPSVMIWGSSMFSLGKNITEVLAENFKELSFVFASGPKGIKESIIDVVKPDIFIFEAGERYANQMYNFCVIK